MATIEVSFDLQGLEPRLTGRPEFTVVAVHERRGELFTGSSLLSLLCRYVAMPYAITLLMR